MGLRHLVAVLIAALAILPANAQQAPKASGESSSKPRAKARADASTPDAGSITDGVYRNSTFGFSYKIPFGWVDRSAKMQEDNQLGKSALLLSVFERPPEAAAEGINSAVVIASESVASYPGLKTAIDYFGPLTELTTSKGFKVVNEPYEFPVGAKPLVRGDFSKEGSTSTMHQTSLVLVQKGWIVSFTFIAGSNDEIDELLEKLSFGTAQKPAGKR
jgi:hypothetical protein